MLGRFGSPAPEEDKIPTGINYREPFTLIIGAETFETILPFYAVIPGDLSKYDGLVMGVGYDTPEEQELSLNLSGELFTEAGDPKFTLITLSTLLGLHRLYGPPVITVGHC